MRGKKSGACQPQLQRAGPASLRVKRGQGNPCADIGVAAHLVGMRMVGVVLVHPPAEAQPDEHVSYGEAEQAVTPACAKHLVVPRVMADEAELGEGESRQCGDGEGRPGVADYDEQDPSSQEGEDGQGDLQSVVAGPPVQETHRSDPERQRVKASRRRVDSNRRPVCG
jgi:hypothetical protein